MTLASQSTAYRLTRDGQVTQDGGTLRLGLPWATVTATRGLLEGPTPASLAALPGKDARDP